MPTLAGKHPMMWPNSYLGICRPTDCPNCRIRPPATRKWIHPDIDCPPSRSSPSFQPVLATSVPQIVSDRPSRCGVQPTPSANIYRQSQLNPITKITYDSQLCRTWRCPTKILSFSILNRFYPTHCVPVVSKLFENNDF